MACEACGCRDAANTCCGMDVPMLDFCDKCAPNHAEQCPEIAQGRATMTWRKDKEAFRRKERG